MVSAGSVVSVVASVVALSPATNAMPTITAATRRVPRVDVLARTMSRSSPVVPKTAGGYRRARSDLGHRTAGTVATAAPA